MGNGGRSVGFPASVARVPVSMGVLATAGSLAATGALVAGMVACGRGSGAGVGAVCLAAGLGLRFGLGLAGAEGSASSLAVSCGNEGLKSGNRIFGPHSTKPCNSNETTAAKATRRDTVSSLNLTGKCSMR